MTTAPTPSSSQGGNMLRVSNPRINNHDGLPKSFRRHRSSKLATPASSASASGLSSPVPNSNAIVFDNLGQAHDPDYMNTLREQLAIIGEKASAAKRNNAKQSASTGFGGAVYAERPSALGLGLSSNFASLDLRASDSSDLDDEDNSTEDEDETRSMARRVSFRARGESQTPSTSSLRSAPRMASNSGAESLASVNSSSPRQPMSPMALSSPPRSPNLTASQPSSSAVSSSKGPASRHLSFSTSTQGDLYSSGRHRGLFARRGSDSPARKTAYLSPTAVRQPSNSVGAANQMQPATASSGRVKKRSPFSSPSNSRPTTAEKDDKEWGFTGIVDVERLRQTMATEAKAQQEVSLFDEDDATDAICCRASAESIRQGAAANEPDLVQAASVSRSTRADSASSNHRAASLRQKGASGEAPVAGAPFHKKRSTSGESARTNISAGPHRLHQRNSSGGSNTKVPIYNQVGGEGMVLSTIQSDRTLTNENSNLLTPRAEQQDYFHGPSSEARRKQLSNPLTPIEAATPYSPATAEEADDEDNKDAAGSENASRTFTSDAEHLADDEASSTPSSPPASKKKDQASQPSSVSASHELRRKVEVFAMGVRFNAFKAKRKLKLGSSKQESAPSS